MVSQAFPTVLLNTKSLALNSLLLTSWLYQQASFCWYSASFIVADSQCSCNKSNCFTISSLFLQGTNLETRALHNLTSVGIITFPLYVSENGVSLVDLLGVVQYAHRTFGNSSAHIPFIPSNLFFNPVTIALLVTLTWPLLYGHAKVEYLFLISRLLQNFWKALLSNCNRLSNTRDSGTPNVVTIFLQTNFLMSTSQMLASASATTHFVK